MLSGGMHAAAYVFFQNSGEESQMHETFRLKKEKAIEEKTINRLVFREADQETEASSLSSTHSG